MDKHLHIVTHEIPWPIDHGGLVDLYYKITALHKLGVKIHLHCFSDHIKPQPELNKYCESVQYYKRKSGVAGLSLHLPYIVYSRRSNALSANLKKDDYPVLLDGIHCTWMLYKGELAGKKVFVRLHNTEYKYYHHLAKLERNFFKKTYFTNESRRLKNYEQAIADKAVFLAVSRQDATLYKKQFHAQDVHFFPVFIPYDTVATHTGRGSYCLYQGNLAINENEMAAEWLLTKVFKGMDIPFVIAGRNPSPALLALIHHHGNACIVSNPSVSEMQDLIARAQLNLLPSFNDTGVKLKLLNALYNGRHCIVNNAAVEGAVINNLCHVANTPEDFRSAISRLFETEIRQAEVQERQSELQGVYDNEKNALHLMTLIW